MIRRIVLTSASVIALAAAASAGDPPPVGDWSGLYAGLHVGGVMGRDKVTDVVPLNFFNGSVPYSIHDTSFIAGGQFGYNWESGANSRGDSWVLGLEADLGGMGLSKRKFEPGAVGIPPVTSNAIRSGFYGDVTGRLGYSFDPVLVYVKGGFAFYDGDAAVTNTGGCGLGTAKTSGLYAGDTVGAGLEYRYDPTWSAKVEYQHFDFGNNTATLHIGCGAFPYNNSLTADAVSLGINFRLGPDVW